MKVAIIHYWLVGMRGGEKVVEELCNIYPQADIFTHVYVPDKISPGIRAHRIQPTFINALPRASRMYKTYLPLMPLALEQLDLQEYDLVISSESGPAKGVITRADALHVCYCHTPMRYIWNMYHDYRRSAGFMTRLLMPPLAHYLRLWDVASAARVDSFVANSQTVARRIRRYYGAEATVIFPPVDTLAFSVAPSSELEDYYLMAGELVSYKKPELAVEAFNLLRKRLVVIGGGEMLTKIKEIAGPTVSVLGAQPFEVLKAHYGRCRALIFPGEEDFGMVPIEAMASGRPIVAFRRGGATETVVDGVTGVFFDEQTTEAIVAAVGKVEATHFETQKIVDHAAQFGRDPFIRKFRAHVESLARIKCAEAVQAWPKY